MEQSKSTSSLPIDITSEILIRLPEKSVAKFRSVSKLWSSITTDPYFINLFETQSPRPSLLLCFQKDENLFVSSIPQHTRISNRSYSSSQPIDRYHMKFPGDYSYYTSTESVHGLICFEDSREPSGKPIVWNPSKKQFLTLPKPRKSWKDRTVVLGYDPIDGKHKVVCIPYNIDCDVCEILTLGSAQESWRTVRTTYTHCTDTLTSGICIKGVIYYLAYQMRDLVLMSFDVRSEKFDMRVLPTSIRYYHTLINYGGRLAFINKNNCKRLWILEDAEKDKWSSQDFLVPFGHHDPISLSTDFSLKGITHVGEFIYVPDTFHKSFYVLFFDPVRNSCRRFEFNRLTDDESGRDDGAQNQLYLYAFPNHIESQMSL